MRVTKQQAWTQEAFFDWVQSQERRYEYDGFAPVAMTGGTPLHAVLISNLMFALRRRLQGGAWQALGPDAGLVTVGDAVRYPDVIVTCQPIDFSKHVIEGVVVAFEVVSLSSERLDRIVKVREYAAVASMRQYVIVEYRSIGLTVLSRSGAGESWTAKTLDDGELLAMPEQAIEVPVAEIYSGVVFQPEL